MNIHHESCTKTHSVTLFGTTNRCLYQTSSSKIIHRSCLTYFQAFSKWMQKGSESRSSFSVSCFALQENNTNANHSDVGPNRQIPISFWNIFVSLKNSLGNEKLSIFRMPKQIIQKSNFLSKTVILLLALKTVVCFPYNDRFNSLSFPNMYLCQKR